MIAISVLTLASLTLLAGTSIPLGVPGEWTWARVALAELDVPSLLLSVIVAAAFWGVAFWGEMRLHRVMASPGVIPGVADRGRILMLCVLAFSVFFTQLCLLPGVQGIGRSPTVLYYKRTEGYFWQAAFDVKDTGQFLRGYRDSISTGDDPDRYLHLGTHPPGLTLGYLGLLKWFDQSPVLTERWIAIEPSPIREAFESLRQFPTPNEEPLTAGEEATLWAATLLTLAAMATACWPIYRLTERMADSIIAWRAAVLWPLVPSLLVFFPKSDLLYPVLATTSCWLWLDGWSRLCRTRCVCAGFGFFCGLMLTLALAPVALLLTVQTILERWAKRHEFVGRSAWADASCVLAAVAGLTIPLAILRVGFHCDVLAIWMQNLHNHGMFYSHHLRSYSSWLIVNPLEAALAVGVPVACLAVTGVVEAVRSGPRSSPLARLQTWAWLIIWSILWLSGKNMGEAARLWIFLAPWPVMTAAVAMSPKRHMAEESDQNAGDSLYSRLDWPWGILLALQLLAWLVTSNCVDGFHFAEMMPQAPVS